tara:strand:+ start:447 stop:857 length:411 start_codon:yes stop_codon:yes gene_type:complete
MEKVVARLRELRNQMMGIDQESIDNNPKVYGQKFLISRHIMTVIWNLNALLIELREAINVENNEREEERENAKSLIDLLQREIDEKDVIILEQCQRAERRESELALWKRLAYERRAELVRRDKNAKVGWLLESKNA